MTAARSFSPAVIAALVILIGGSLSTASILRLSKANLIKRPIEVERRVRSIPAQTPNWVQIGQDHQEEAAVEGVLGTKNYLTRVYMRKPVPGTPAPGAKADVVEVHLAYYTGMIDTVPHAPERCLVGGGWSITGSAKVVPLNLTSLVTSPDSDVPPEFGPIQRARINSPGSPSNGQRVRLPSGMGDLGLRVTEFSAPGENNRYYAGYFFIANGGIATSAERVRSLSFDLRSEYAYYMKVQTASASATSAEDLARLSSDLLSELFPEIMLCVPDWIDVQMGLFPPDNPRRNTAK